MQAEEFIDWLNAVERTVIYKDISDDKKVKLVEIRLKIELRLGGNS